MLMDIIIELSALAVLVLCVATTLLWAAILIGGY
jgi:hypothetical protein